MGWNRPQIEEITPPHPPKMWLWISVFIAITIICGVCFFAFPNIFFNETISGHRFLLLIFSSLTFIWLVVLSISLLRYGNKLSQCKLAGQEENNVYTAWKNWAGRYQSVIASHVLLPEQINISHLVFFGDVLEPRYRQSIKVTQFPNNKIHNIVVSLLSAIKKELVSLPLSMPVNVTLVIPYMEDNAAIWRNYFQSAWDESIGIERSYDNIDIVSVLSPMILNEWLVSIDEIVHVVIVLQLPEESECSEMAAAFILVSDDYAEQYHLPIKAKILRSMDVTIDNFSDRFSFFLDIQQPAAEVDQIWLMGREESVFKVPVLQQIGKNNAAFSTENIDDIERVIGTPGPQAGWVMLGIAVDIAHYHKKNHMTLTKAGANWVINTVQFSAQEKRDV